MNRFMRCMVAVVFTAYLVLGGSSWALAAQDSWVISMYMCGSDLESEYGSATGNLEDMQTIQLPKNVRVVIQTGGANEWHTDGISSDRLGRYVYDSTGFHEIEQLPDANMGDVTTLENFLRFTKDNFPADHRMLLFWDHGGGSLGGFCFDERYGNGLSLNDLRQALNSVETANEGAPAYDLVLFDACLMATIETANTLHGFSRYMAASEEIMPGTGTDYASWFGALAQNPAIDGRELGKVICDTYLTYCKVNESDDMATLSLIDLSKLPALNGAYERLGQEALRQSRQDPKAFFTAFDRVANNVEKYGYNEGEDWSNMIDLGSLAQEVEGLESAPAFNQALQEAVVCRTAGPYRRYGMGLSGYYSLDGMLMTWLDYDALHGRSPAFARLYQEMLSGSGDGVPWYYFDIESLENAPVVLDEDNKAAVYLSPEETNSISRAAFLLCFYDNDNRLVYLGSDEKLNIDWDQGAFREDFDGMWPALNGYFLPMYISEVNKDYILYNSSIKLNGKECYVDIAYDYDKEEFKILGAQRILDNGWVDRDIIQLKAGDRIVPLFTDENNEEYWGEEFILDGEPVLQDEPLPDDTYAFAFEFTSAHGETAYSEAIHFEIVDGRITAIK